MHVLIQTIYKDFHAAVVSWGLTKKGVKSTLWCPQDITHLTSVSTRISNQSRHSNVSERKETQVEQLADCDVFWNRRYSNILPPNECNENDRLTIERESKKFLTSIRNQLSLDSFAINDVAKQDIANDKLLQLRSACESGLTIPETIISNDKADIEIFAKTHNSFCIKPYTASIWESNGKRFVNFTKKLTQLPRTSDSAYFFCPNIFQEYIEKKYEARVVVMGNSLFALQIDTDSGKPENIDWRINQTAMQAKEIKVPHAIEQKILNFMKSLGLVFGSLDFVVNPDGDWVFLECNVQGQFLWFESYISSYSILDAFCEFIISRDETFIYEKEKSKNRIGINEFRESDRYIDYYNSMFTDKLEVDHDIFIKEK